MNRKEERGPWYLLTGLVIGVILGIAYAWLVQPAEYVDTSPASLREDFKDRYRALIAAAYVANGDIVRARARLELLEDEDIYRSLAEQAQRTLAEQGSSDEARALGLLALALGKESSSQPVIITPISQSSSATPSATSTVPFTPSPQPTETSTPTSTVTSTPSPEPTTAETLIPTQTSTSEAGSLLELEGTPTEMPIPRPTATPTVTRTPTLTPGFSFELVDSRQLCNQALPEPLIQVFVVNASDEPASGMEVIITWDQGEERFFTGLKPEKGLGYADFTPIPGIIYTLRVGNDGKPVTGLTALSCQNSAGGAYWGAWALEFKQP
jgi:hypothetical protein